MNENLETLHLAPTLYFHLIFYFNTGFLNPHSLFFILLHFQVDPDPLVKRQGSESLCEFREYLTRNLYSNYIQIKIINLMRKKIQTEKIYNFVYNISIK